jgi:adenosyl cobinamide kinase/adenosyl cobinamide phosphate guanylyltransferase
LRRSITTISAFVATGATDAEIADWIGEHAKKRSRAEIIAWNNKQRDLHLSDLPLELQEYMEDYIQQCLPRNRVVHHWFDVYDLEEERI